MKTQKLIYALALTLAIGCAQAPRSPQLVSYQSKASKVLAHYTGAVSKGLTRGVTSGGRKAFDYGSEDPLIQDWNHRNGNWRMKQSVRDEVQDCKEQIKAIPKDCNNLSFMVSSLTRCLNRVLTDHNPVFAYSYRNLDHVGQQYYGYGIDWRRPRPVQYFSMHDYGQVQPYATTGWLPGPIYYQ